MQQLPIDCIINITHFLQDKSIINLTHTNKFLYSLQELITLTNIPAYPNTNSNFQFKINYWFPSYPDPKAKHVIIKAPKRSKIKTGDKIPLPQNYQSLESLTSKYQINPFPSFDNLTILRLYHVDDTPISLPVTLKELRIDFKGSYSLTNLSELRHLEFLNITGNNLTVNLDDHPGLQNLNLFGTNDNIVISKIHTNLQILTHFNYVNRNDISLTPNLTSLHGSVIYGDLNVLTKLERIVIHEVVGPRVNLGNLKNLESCIILKGKCYIPESDYSNVELLSISDIELVSDVLFPKLRSLTIHDKERSGNVTINHTTVTDVRLYWLESVSFVNMGSVRNLTLHCDNLKCLTESGCDFGNLETISLESHEQSMLRLDIDGMGKLKVVSFIRGRIELLGESDVLKKVYAVKIVGEKDDVMRRFRNLDVKKGIWGR